MAIDKRQIAHHEAGHAVIAYRFKHGLGSLTIRPNENASTLGSCSSEGEWQDGSRDREQIIVLYAGFAAERAYNPKADKQGAAGDELKAANLLQPGSESTLRARAEQLVQENWIQISAVADALLEHETLDEDWTIIVDCVDEGEDWHNYL